MDPVKFKDDGYLQEVNRRFLHILGLSLGFAIGEDGGTQVVIYDQRNDMQGMIFPDGLLQKRKVDFINAEFEKRSRIRQQAFSFVEQPVE
jgi:hypothetical protein